MTTTRKLFLFLGLPLVLIFVSFAAWALKDSKQPSVATESTTTSQSEIETYTTKPTLHNLGGVTLAAFDQATSLAGNIKFSRDGLDAARGRETHVYLFGQKLPKNADDEPQRINPNIEFGGIATQIDIIAAIDGVVVHIEQQPGSDDYEVFLARNENDTWVVGYDHLVNLTVKKGDRVKVGQKLGLVAPQNSGGYRYELQVNDELTKMMHCPTELLDTSVKVVLSAQLEQLTKDWAAWYGKDVFGTHVGGCVKSSLTAAESEGR